nr:thiamine ABC transporter substrate-binding protein [Pseudomonadota bacterium]
MRTRFLPLIALALGLAVVPAAAQEKLTVYTYESFTSEWGPGPQIEMAFEAECGCDVQFVAVA